MLQLFSSAGVSSSGLEGQAAHKNGVREPALILVTQRTLAGFQEIVGVDYTRKQIHTAARKGCRFVENVRFASDQVYIDGN